MPPLTQQLSRFLVRPVDRQPSDKQKTQMHSPQELAARKRRDDAFIDFIVG